MSAPRSNEPDRLLDHEYDGIREYDNPLPRWWLWIFWATILYSVLYVLDVPWIGPGAGRIASYEREMAEAKARYAQATPALALTDEALRALAAIPAEVEEGRAQFAITCAPCHRQDGGGMIGPNLTDRHWIHGGRPTEILRTVGDGVPAKGMPAWNQMLKPDQVTAVVAYVLTLRGTRPAVAKAPEGVDADSVTAATGAVGVVPERAAAR